MREKDRCTKSPLSLIILASLLSFSFSQGVNVCRYRDDKNGGGMQKGNQGKRKMPGRKYIYTSFDSRSKFSDCPRVVHQASVQKSHVVATLEICVAICTVNLRISIAARKAFILLTIRAFPFPSPFSPRHSYA